MAKTDLYEYVGSKDSVNLSDIEGLASGVWSDSLETWQTPIDGRNYGVSDYYELVSDAITPHLPVTPYYIVVSMYGDDWDDCDQSHFLTLEEANEDAIRNWNLCNQPIESGRRVFVVETTAVDSSDRTMWQFPEDAFDSAKL